MKHLWLLLLASVLVSCGGSGVEVTRQQYGEAWPFTVESAVLDCDAGGRAIVSTKRPNVTGTWALTGAARSYGYPAVDPFWRDSPTMPGTKVPLTQMIALALRQCL